MVSDLLCPHCEGDVHPMNFDYHVMNCHVKNSSIFLEDDMIDQDPGLSITEHTIWFTKLSIVDGDGGANAHLRLDYDGDLELVLRDRVYRGRVLNAEFDTKWDDTDSSIIMKCVKESLTEAPPEILMKLQI